MTIFQTGQRWISESEPELGLGTVVAADVAKRFFQSGVFRLTEVRIGVVVEVDGVASHSSRSPE